MSGTPYTVGLDLGTTHSALAWVRHGEDAGADAAAIEVLGIPQLTAPGNVEERPLLPSFVYLPIEGEFAPPALALPWAPRTGAIVGELARALGAKTPLRLVSSAKSWLSAAGVDRRGPILPAGAPDDVPHLSPLDASVLFLEHLRAAWDAAHPDAPLSEQQTVLTVPASFDPAARELTAEAARRAGLARATLLEEPQAAFYSWIHGAGRGFREQVRAGDLVLVVDVGGGTSDFSLIAVVDQGGSVELERVAVGEHILLGGDNMDLALAHLVRGKLEQRGERLDGWQMSVLAHACRAAKERLLGPAPQAEEPIVLPSRGSKLVGGSLRAELTREEVAAAVLDGFFPRVGAEARPAARARTALTQLGLPYAQDPAVTRHLAAFLGRQSQAAAEAAQGRRLPTAILLNGGVFRSPVLAGRLVEVIGAWCAGAGAPAPRVFAGTDLDLAVARGAAYYGHVRRGGGVRIRGGTARSFYVGIEAALPAVPGIEPPLRAVCVAPFGMEEGSEAELPPQQFGLVVGEPVRFRFLGSSVRRADRVGDIVEDWSADELQELPAIEATLPAENRTPGEVVPVRLHAAVTEVGTLRLEAVSPGGERWDVELNVRESA
ncbi:MAG: Hsp70 family protein [Acidobacteria bacterium]|nr:Hsp70 family protein [Acidobacteriota bacterium]